VMLKNGFHSSALLNARSIWEEDWKPRKQLIEEEDSEDESDSVEEDEGPERVRRPIVEKHFDLYYVVTTLRELKATDVCVIDVKDKVEWVKYMIHATGRSRAHIRSLGNALLDQLKQRRPGRAWKLNQADCDFWVILNSGDILINLWTEEEREEYDLERTWVLRRNEKNHMSADFDDEAETEWIYDEEDEMQDDYDPDVEKIKGFS